MESDPASPETPDAAARARAEQVAQRLRVALARMTEHSISPARLRGEPVRSDFTLWQNIDAVDETKGKYGLTLRLTLRPDIAQSEPARSDVYYEEFRSFAHRLAEGGVLILGRTRHVPGKNERWPIVELSVANADSALVAGHMEAIEAAVDAAVGKRRAVRRD